MTTMTEETTAAPCGYLPAEGWVHEFARDAHRDSCGACGDIESKPAALVLQSGAVAHRSVQDVLQAMNDLKMVRTFIANELIEKTDYGTIPGTGDKKNLLLPGAQKVCMFFNVRPEYNVERAELGAGHVEYIVKTNLISRVSGLPVGAGVGSCATMEGKYRYRNSEKVCPECGKNAIIKGKAEYGGGWLCYKKKDGCGAKFPDGAAAIESQITGKVENENIWDVRNTVLKMAKKRSVVDASIALGCLSELFTQDLEDIFDLGAGAAVVTASVEREEKIESDPQQNTASTTHPPASQFSGNTAVITLAAVVMKDGKPHVWKYQGVENAMFLDSEGKKWKFIGDTILTADIACGDGTPLKVEFTSDKYGKTVLAAERA